MIEECYTQRRRLVMPWHEDWEQIRYAL